MMKPLLRLAAAASVLSGSAFAQSVPAARVAGVLGGSADFPGAALAPAAIPTPAMDAPAVAAPAAGAIVPPGLWASLQAPDAATLQWLLSRVPGLDPASVRELTFEAGDALFAAAVAQGQTPLDFFTDQGFRGSNVFYISQQTVTALFARYETRAITPASGTTTDGQAFAMQALLVGNGRIDALYDRDPVVFNNPILDNDRYTLSGRVTERIQGPGDVTVEGVVIKYGIFNPVIQRITKISSNEARVDTSYGSRTRPAYPIVRKN